MRRARSKFRPEGKYFQILYFGVLLFKSTYSGRSILALQESSEGLRVDWITRSNRSDTPVTPITGAPLYPVTSQ